MDQATQAHSQAPHYNMPEQESQALARRRRLSGVDPAQPPIGLALSGGGVRSATFCLGLLRALAKNGVLHRFDYLSTVSGGGYTGAAFGRLFGAGSEARDVEQGLADDRSLLLWWLRSNGRYLVPSGLRDLLQTWAGQLRGFVATQFEITTLILLLSCMITLPHLLGFHWQAASAPLLTSTLWWVLMPAAGWIVIFMAFAYWWSRDAEDWSVWSDLTICVCTSVMAVYLLSPLWNTAMAGHGKVTMAVIGGILLAAPLSRLWLLLRPSHPAQDQVRYTMALSTSLKYLTLLFLLGATDLLSWLLADQIGATFRHRSILTSAGLAAMLIGVARIALPLLQPHDRKNRLSQLPLTLLANLCGLLLLVLLTLFWLSALQYFVFVARLSALNSWMRWLAVLVPGISRPPAADNWLRWLTVAIPSLAYVVLTGGNLQMINRSSLHAFYRSRIARAYVSVGNYEGAEHPSGPARFPLSPLNRKTRDNADAVKKLTELLEGDDVALPAYSPHTYGGPIHLINCCINQTIDDRTDTYNADRKGVYLTVSSLGLETGAQPPLLRCGADNPLARSTLSEWIAISGAAAGSGMGSLTRTGISALFFLSGFRLGYWWKNRLNPPRFWWSRLGKSRAALQEMLARFPGLRSPVWYLSDGGHFDNTGVYSLLKRELRLIVLADCGADPSYVFTDVENLTRKARIDLDTGIDFIDPESLPTGLSAVLRARFGTPDSIMPNPGSQHLLLARISYPSGASGCLLVVKPRLYGELPLDVAGYADRHRDFPQQSTAQQFFDESQWESYCQLGEVLGLPIDQHLLDMLPGLAGSGTAVCANAVSNDSQPNSMTRRQRMNATIGASLSLGALATVALTSWQAWDSRQSQRLSSGRDVEVQQSAADAVQTDLDAGLGYDPAMHRKLYSLMRRYDDVRNSESMARTMNQLADSLNQACGRLAPGIALVDRCLADYSALRGAVTQPTTWQKAMQDYRNAIPSASLDVLGPPSGEYATATFDAGAPKLVSAAPADVVASVANVSTPPSKQAASAGPTHAGAAEPPAGFPARNAAQPSAAAAKTSRAEVTEVAMQACSGATTDTPQHLIVYVQIYSEEQRAAAAGLLRQLVGFGMATPGIENVVTSASRSGHGAPAAWDKPVFLYSSYSEQAPMCARALARWLAAQPAFSSS
ncbi:MAG: patatin-like phospholipase family protein, partial [Pseudomonadota bacterium]|nr:patatin-like phospholipase family protein [Pseudomonadota bacterium]